MIRRFNKFQLDKVSEILRNDGVVSVPTDTVFGLCARITKEGHEKLVSVKNRPSEKPFPIMCSNISQIKDIAYVSYLAEKVINSFMPGPITVILKKKNLSDFVTNGMDTVAIRMATSKELEEIINKVNMPIFMSSANQSGEEVSKNLDDIERTCPKIDGMLEGEVSFNVASTIVDLTKDEIKILREGPIKLEDINIVLNK